MRAVEEKLLYPQGSRLLVGYREEESYPFEWHYHDAFEITLILKGEGQRFVGDSIEAYNAGDLIFLPPGLSHTWKSSLSSTVNQAIYIQFEVNSFGHGFFEMEDFKELQALMKPSSGFAYRASDLLVKLFKNLLEVKGVLRVVEVLKLLKCLASMNGRSLSSKNFTPEKDPAGRKKMDLLIDIIGRGENLQVPEIASELNMSESSFRRFIKKNTGRSFIDFCNMIQINEASSMLIEGSNAISEIALDCGYRNLSHFNRKFKEYKKMTPREFRNQFKS